MYESFVRRACQRLAVPACERSTIERMGCEAPRRRLRGPLTLVAILIDFQDRSSILAWTALCPTWPAAPLGSRISGRDSSSWSLLKHVLFLVRLGSSRSQCCVSILSPEAGKGNHPSSIENILCFVKFTESSMTFCSVTDVCMPRNMIESIRTSSVFTRLCSCQLFAQ